MQRLGFETLTTVLIPGLIVFVALCIAIDTTYPELHLSEFAEQFSAIEWQVSFLALVASSFLGMLLASVLGFVEGYILEPLSARHIGCSQHNTDWDRYIDSLESANNSYIARIVFYFFFEFRAGVAAILLGSSLLAWPRLAGHWVPGVLIIATGIYLILAAIHDHHSLVKFRHRRFHDSPSYRNLGKTASSV